jgi:hypothetical protein
MQVVNVENADIELKSANILWQRETTSFTVNSDTQVKATVPTGGKDRKDSGANVPASICIYDVALSWK